MDDVLKHKRLFSTYIGLLFFYFFKWLFLMEVNFKSHVTSRFVTKCSRDSKGAHCYKIFVLTFENADAQCNFDFYVQKHTYAFFGEIMEKLVVSPPYYGTQINRCGTYGLFWEPNRLHFSTSEPSEDV